MICQSQDAEKAKSETPWDKQKNKNKRERGSSQLVNLSDFWRLTSFHEFGYAGDALGRKDRTYCAQLRRNPNAVLRTTFKERMIGRKQRWQGDKERTGLRLRTLQSCHKEQVHMKEFPRILSYAFL